MKLSRILSNQNNVSRQHANAVIAAGRVLVDNQICRDAGLEISRFQSVVVDQQVLQAGVKAHYLMLNKPAGYLSATKDDEHPTVLELVAPDLHPELHIAGRLDRASTGLLILTNDGAWSRRLTDPVVRIPKVYRVTTAHPISDTTAVRFAEGIWFNYEQLTTSPAELDILAPTEARITIYEGRYHQVKRMFHAVGNQVLSLHREAIGNIQLDNTLDLATYRKLTACEITSILA
ncbi:pseudouridine synthase [uncultured Marinobacter sp.]|uniref:pseudouridine synthase n=1 Tax=uncultured Marinobacter sp. TaxID=187379 RepID=UPI0030D9929A